MKITFLTPALAAILGLALTLTPVTLKAQTTNAATGTAPAPAKKEKKKSEFTQFPKEAAITAIDATSLTISTAKGPVTLAIAADTKFETIVAKKKTPATAADFAVGDKVTGSYKTNADGTMTAHSVRKKVEAAK